MTDLERILALWRELEKAGSDYVLATVVSVDGPSYRKPGAHMLLSGDGRRAGTISGGCLEAQVAQRAWWLTANGPTIQSYSTAADDGDRPFGSGCGGTVRLLLERRDSAAAFLREIGQAFDRRIPMAISTILEGERLGHRVVLNFDSAGAEIFRGMKATAEGIDAHLLDLAKEAIACRCGFERKIADGDRHIKGWADYRQARPGLGVFGAGDDAQPLVRLAKELGWFVWVSDGRSHLVSPERFPGSDRLNILPIAEMGEMSPDPSMPFLADFRSEDAALVMTHSFEQDSRILAFLLAMRTPPAYIGVLGPQRRTYELLKEAAGLMGIPSSAMAAQTERWMTQLHAPTGLDLGAESPETIALSVLAEIQKLRSSATGLPLREVRSATEPRLR